MNHTNINDPAGINALLQSLRASQAWADLQQSSDQSVTEPPPASQSSSSITAADDSAVEDKPIVPEHASGSAPSVADLLAQLQNPRPGPPPAQSSSHSSPSYSTQLPPPKAPSLPKSASLDDAESFLRDSFPKREQRKDLRTLTLQQSLPILAELGERKECVDCVLKLKKDQDQLERKLWEERESILEAQRDKVKSLVTKANIIGTGISEREAKALTQSFQSELSKFDKERVLPAWDSLIARQQAALEKLGVPTMFVGGGKAERERQQRVVQVLEGIVGGEEK